MGGYAWVTLATNDSYSLGALVLAHSLKQVKTNQQLAVLVTPGVTSAMREKLATVFNVVQEVNILDSRDEANLRLLKRPELGVTFTKLHCWRLTQFDKCVFLDADTLVLQNCDELFDRDELSAAPDVGWPDCFNSGVFVYRPSNETYENLIQFALDKGSFDGGDQGLLNLYFSDWAYKDINKHLPFIYNMCSTACYSYLPAFKQFGGNAKIIHFIGAMKPWLQYFDTETKQVRPSEDMQHLKTVLQHWWNIFCSLIHPKLTPDMARSSSDVTPTNYFRHFPHNSTFPDPILTNKDDYQKIWDPWEEYDSRQSSNTLNSVDHQENEPLETKPIESHNTNACSYKADEIVPEPPTHSLFVPEPPTHSLFIPEQVQPPLLSDPKSFHETQVDDVLPRSLIKFHKTSIEDDFQHNLNNDVNIPVVPPVDSSQKSSEIQHFPELDRISPPVVVELTLKHTEPALPALASECEATTTVTKASTLHKNSHEDKNNSGLAGAFAQLRLGVPRTAEQSALDDHLRRQGWEVGNIDYLGKDSFDNIWSKICETLGTATASIPPKPKEPTPPPTEVKASEQTVTEATKIEMSQESVESPPQVNPTETSMSCEAPLSSQTQEPVLAIPTQTQETLKDEQPKDLDVPTPTQCPAITPKDPACTVADKPETAMEVTCEKKAESTLVCSLPATPKPDSPPEVSVCPLAATIAGKSEFVPESTKPEKTPTQSDLATEESIKPAEEAPQPALEKSPTQPVSESLKSEPILEQRSQSIEESIKQQPTSEPAKPQPVSESPKPQSASESAKPQPISDPIQPQSVPEAVKPQPVPEPVKPQSVPEPVKPQSVPEPVKPQSVPEPVKPQSVPEPVKPQSVPEPVKPQSVPEPVKPQSVPEPVKPQSVPEPAKPQSVSKPVKPQSVPEPVKPQPTVEQVKPQSDPTLTETQAVCEAVAAEQPKPITKTPETETAPQSSKKPEGAGTTTPTPPPRKGSGTSKKSKSKK